MSERKFTLRQNDRVTPCPTCRNNTEFIGHSDYAGEDHCNIWVVCKCGFDPTDNDNLGSMYRFEDVWGGLSNSKLEIALDCWNEAIAEIKEKAA